MKTVTLIGAILLILTGLSAAATVTSWDSGPLNGGNGISIPDGSVVGVALDRMISGLDGGFNTVSGSVQVRLNVSGGYNGDLFGYLVLNNGPGSTVPAILLNRVGQDEAHPFGSSGSGFNVTLSDSGVTNIHSAPGGATGVWKPDGATLDGTFAGLNAKGTWTLFLADLSGGYTSKLMSWGLDVTVNSVGSVARLQWTTAPGGAVSGVAFTNQPVLRTVDQSGNFTTNGLPASLIVTIAKTSGSGTLFGTTNYNIGTSGGNGTITGSGLGVTGSGSFNLTASVPAGYGVPVSGMAVWLDGSDASTVLDSSPVTAWNDKSGNGKNFATTIGTNGTITYTATINGRGVVTFPNGRGLLNTTYTNDGPDTTFFVMMRHANAAWSVSEGPISSSSGGSDVNTTNAWAISSFFGSVAVWRYNGTFFSGINLPAADGNTPFIWSGAFDNAGNRYLVGATSLGQTAEAEGTPGVSGNFAINQLLVGGRLSAPSMGTSGSWCNGDIGEVIIYNTFLADADRDAVKAYLSNKWLNASSPAYAAIASATTTVSLATAPSNTITGSVALQSFTGTNRMVRFVMSSTNGPTYLQTNDQTLTFSGGSASYNLTVPTNATHISAKTAWNLRRRQAVTFTGGAATVNFTGGNNLKGGDLITVAVPPGTIASTDNAVTSSDYLLLLGNYLQTVGGSAAIGRVDIDGDGAITSSDYLLLLGNYLTSGDPQ